MNPDQLAAFQANGGYTPAELSVLLLGAVFAALLLWGAWALGSAYTGWAEGHLSQRQFLAVAVRLCALYLVLGFLLLS